LPKNNRAPGQLGKLIDRAAEMIATQRDQHQTERFTV
jgi:hypothetical protein